MLSYIPAVVAAAFYALIECFECFLGIPQGVILLFGYVNILFLSRLTCHFGVKTT